MGTDHVKEAKQLLAMGCTRYSDPVVKAAAHALVDIAESLRVIAENAGAR